MVQPGSRLAHYEVVAAIGKGGMGEVWRARDTKLGREVAIKTLPEAFARDADRLARFEREAKLLASLNHPRIAAIYGLEEQGGTRFLVLELIEGETLADRIARGAVPVDEAVALGLQIAEALEAAHEKCVVHRDLKPANIKITPGGQVKVLDFGLAKAYAASAASLSQSPTLSVAATLQGTILGTAAYMSPEQARGQEVDARSDIWAFGCVLYEMLSGRQTFGGTTAVDIIGAVVKTDPGWRLLPPETPLGLRRLLRRCLRKDLDRRLRHAGDVRLELEESREEEAPVAIPAETGRRRIATWAGWAFGLVCLLALGFYALLPGNSGAAAEAVRFTVEAPRVNGIRPGPGAAISPDGRMLAYVAPDDSGADVIWIWPLANLEAERLRGTEGAFLPFWSPDGRSLGFFADQSLKRIDIAGGTPRTLAPAPYGFGGSWNADGVIVYAPNFRVPLRRVSAEGVGESVPVTTFDSEREDGAHTSPTFLSDGRHFIFAMNASPEHRGIYLGSLDSTDVSLLVRGSFGATVSDDDFLLSIEEGTIRAQKLDVEERTLVGRSIAVAEEALDLSNVYGDAKSLSVSASGRLAYRRGLPGRRQLTWFDRARGEPAVDTIGRPGSWDAAVLSPDETKVAATENLDILVFDLERQNALSALTSGSDREWYPVWSPDSRQIAYAAGQEGSQSLVVELASGTGEPEVLLEDGGSPFYWTAEGYLTYFDTSLENAEGVYIVDMNGDRQGEVFIDTPAAEHESHLSPGARWMAYVSDESGRPEVYVETFPRSGERYPISSAGGSQPVWRADGEELFYLALDGTLMAVDIQTEPEFAPGPPRPLFQTHSEIWAARNSYSPSRDGQRFLVNVDPEVEVFRTGIVLNWPSLLEE